MKPHKHAELIKAWADGAEIEARDHSDMPWEPAYEPTWNVGCCEYRIKPAAPKWPQTTMTQNELWSQIDNVRNAPALEVFANMVIARACETSQVIPADVHAERMRAAFHEGVKSVQCWPDREIAIAINVRAACLAKHPNFLTNDDLNKIIAAVK